MLQEALIKYQETALNYRLFVEWRYKIILQFFVSLGAVFLLTQVFLGHASLKHLIFLPFMFAAISAYIFALITKRTTTLMKASKKQALALEMKLGELPGAFAAIEDTAGLHTHYRAIQEFVFFGGGIVFLALSVYLFFKYQAWLFFA